MQPTIYYVAFEAIMLTTNWAEIMQMICKWFSVKLLSHVQRFTPFMSQESSYSLWLSDEENIEAGRQNRDTDTETDEYKEKDKHQHVTTEGGGRVQEC